MSVPSDCCSPCTTPSPVNVPGPTGASAIAYTLADFVIPIVGNTVTVSVTTVTSFAVNQNVFIGGANFEITGINTGAVTLQLKTLGFTSDTAPGATVISGTIVCAVVGNLVPPLGYAMGGTNAATRLAALVGLTPNMAGVAALTDNTTGASSGTLAAGVGECLIAFYLNMADITAVDIINGYTPGFAFKILGLTLHMVKAVTTGGKAATLTPKINGVALTGGVLALSGTYALNQQIQGAAISGLNTGTSASTLTLTGSAVTPFTEGEGWIIIRIQNMDTANAFASLAAKVAAIISGVTT